jgi:Peptide methionine sulfoxide reductase
MTQKCAVLAGGCFWGMQDLIRRHDGVISTRVGYTGGNVPNATYRQPPHTCRSDRNCLRPRKDKLPQAVGILFPNPRSNHEKPPGQ